MRTHYCTRTEVRLTTGRNLFDNTFFGQVDDGVDIVIVRGNHYVTAIRREKGIVQVPADTCDLRYRHVRCVQIHDPHLACLFERDHEVICVGSTGDHTRVCLDHLAVRVDAAQFH